MGLDICLRRPFKPIKFDEKSNYEVLEPSNDGYDGIREVFKEFIFETDLEFYNESAALEREGRNPSDFHIVGMSVGETATFTFEPVNGGDSFEIENIPLFMRRVAVICYEEIGWQRKGANAQFYSDDMWSSDFVLTLKEIKEHQSKYFMEGTGPGQDFQKNIIDKFVEGETYVIYC